MTLKEYREETTYMSNHNHIDPEMILAQWEALEADGVALVGSEMQKRYPLLEDGICKCIGVASPTFNAAFAYEGYSERNPQGGEIWLKKKYQLSDEQLQWLVKEYEAGNQSALKELFNFEQLAERRLSQEGHRKLREAGFIR